MRQPSRWGRWPIDNKQLGRWHAIAELVQGQLPDGRIVPAVMTACGKPRLVPHIQGQRPKDGEPVCKRCKYLDDLRNSPQASEEEPTNLTITMVLSGALEPAEEPALARVRARTGLDPAKLRRAGRLA